jgi:hypothetical protein
MSHTFGASISRTFYALNGNEPIQLPSQLPALYLFSALPELADAQSGTGAIDSKATWTQGGVSPWPNSYTFDPVPEPEAAITDDFSQTYYEAINFILETGGQAQTIVRALEIAKVKEQEDQPDATVALIKEIFPAITNYLDDTEIDNYIKLALDEVKIDLEAQGWAWHELIKLSNIRLAVAYRAIALGALAQVRQTGDRHEFRYNEFNAKHQAILKAARLQERKETTSLPTSERQAQRGFTWVSR